MLDGRAQTDVKWQIKQRAGEERITPRYVSEKVRDKGSSVQHITSYSQERGS